MSDAKHHSVAGGWLGTYHYRGVPHVTGVQTGHDSAFTKTYQGPRRGCAFPVEYEGKLSEDGRSMRGTRHIRQAHGVWDTRHLWAEQNRAEREIAEEAADHPRELTVV